MGTKLSQHQTRPSDALFYVNGEVINHQEGLNDVRLTEIIHSLVHSQEKGKYSLASKKVIQILGEEEGGGVATTVRSGLREEKTQNSASEGSKGSEGVEVGLHNLDFMMNNTAKAWDFLTSEDGIDIHPLELKVKNGSQLGNFKLLHTIGKGGFSQVLLVRDTKSSKIYAMKVINRKMVESWGKLDCIMNEVHILSTVSHPYIVKMHKKFEENSHLCLVLDYCLGGDLFYLLTKFTRFPEKVARFYLCEVIVALEHLHSLNILYRDLKPTNILIDHEGHIKLTDFGLSLPFFTEGSVSSMFCGTPEYMAPEMLLKIGHDRSIDFYNCGILLYEMLVGIPPFYNTDRRKMYTSVLKDQPKFYSHMSKQAQDLISKLLQKEPSERLGANYGFFEIKQHPFFSSVSWNDVYQKKLKPPYLPSIRESNFLTEFTKMPIMVGRPEQDILEEAPSDDQYGGHSTEINQNREQVEDEFEAWFKNYRDEHVKEVNPQDTWGAEFSAQKLQIQYNKDANRLGQCSPTSSIEIGSVESPNYQEFFNQNKTTAACEPRQARFLSEDCKTSQKPQDFDVPKWPKLSKNSTTKMIKMLDFDNLELPEDESVQSDRKRTVPDLNFSEVVDKIEEEKVGQSAHSSVSSNYEHEEMQKVSPNQSLQEVKYSSPVKLKQGKYPSLLKMNSSPLQQPKSDRKGEQDEKKSWLTPLKRLKSSRIGETERKSGGNRNQSKSKLPKCLKSYIYLEKRPTKMSSYTDQKVVKKKKRKTKGRSSVPKIDALERGPSSDSSNLEKLQNKRLKGVGQISPFKQKAKKHRKSRKVEESKGDKASLTTSVANLSSTLPPRSPNKTKMKKKKPLNEKISSALPKNIKI